MCCATGCCCYWILCVVRRMTEIDPSNRMTRGWQILNCCYWEPRYRQQRPVYQCIQWGGSVDISIYSERKTTRGNYERQNSDESLTCPSSSQEKKGYRHSFKIGDQLHWPSIHGHDRCWCQAIALIDDGSTCVHRYSIINDIYWCPIV